jgi:transporter family protein
MKGELLALLAALLWGIAPIFDKIVASSNVSPFLANLVRATGGIIFLLIAVLSLRQFDFSTFTTKNVAYLLIAGALAGGLAMVLYYTALKHTQASRVIPLTSIYPLFTVFFSAMMLGEKISPKVVVGTILIVLGVVLVSSSS